MPRLSLDRLPKYRHHQRDNAAVVRIDGQDFYLGRFGSPENHEYYRRLISEWEANGRKQPPTVPGSEAEPMMVVELVLAYHHHAHGYYRDPDGGATDEARLIDDALAHVRRLYDRTAAVEFGPKKLKAVRKSMIDADWSRKHINKQVSRVKRMFRWAAEEELLPGRVYQDISSLAGLKRGRSNARETDPVSPIDDATVAATLEFLPPVVADMVRFQRLTGCRPEEVCLLKPGNIDRNGEVWRYRPYRHKTRHQGRDRVIFMGPRAQDVARPYLLRPSGSYCFSPEDSEQKRRVAVNARHKIPANRGNRPGSNRRTKPQRKPGKRYTTASYRRAIHRACDLAFPLPETLAPANETKKQWRAQLTCEQLSEVQRWQSHHRWSPNQLRHAAGTEIRRRFGLEAAQVALGHAKADVTQVYAERDQQKAATVMAEVG